MEMNFSFQFRFARDIIFIIIKILRSQLSNHTKRNYSVVRELKKEKKCGCECRVFVCVSLFCFPPFSLLPYATVVCLFFSLCIWLGRKMKCTVNKPEISFLLLRDIINLAVMHD